jgi:hypothetical protein
VTLVAAGDVNVGSRPDPGIRAGGSDRYLPPPSRFLCGIEMPAAFDPRDKPDYHVHNDPCRNGADRNHAKEALGYLPNTLKKLPDSALCECAALARGHNTSD